LGELEREIAEMARKEKAELEASEENARRETAKRGIAQITALKGFISKTGPFIRIGGILGIILALFWVGSWAMPQFLLPSPTAKANLTARPTSTLRKLQHQIKRQPKQAHPCRLRYQLKLRIPMACQWCLFRMGNLLWG
jgi:hypothetical protein